MCRFYLLLAGAVGKRQGISIPYPSPTPLLTPGGYPLRRGISAAAVDRDLVSLYPVQIFNPHFDVMFGCLVFGLGSLAFQKITLGLCRSFFIGGGIGCSFLRLREVLLWSIVGLPRNVLRRLTRAISSNFVGCKPISPNMPGAKVS